MIKVINLRDKKIKLVLLMMGVILLLICTSSFFDKMLHRIANNISEIALDTCININLPTVKVVDEKFDYKEEMRINKVLNLQLGMLDNIQNIQTDTEEIKEEDINLVEEYQDVKELEEVKLAEKEVVIENVSENNIDINYNTGYGNVKIKNQSDYDLSQEILTPNYQLSNMKDIIIFHTHTCESYTPTETNMYTMTGSYRTTDLNYSVAKVGGELKKHLENYGYSVIHDTTFHDYPAYSGSYGKSMITIENLLNQKPDTQVIIDVHRDAVGASNEYAPSVKINGEYVAQLMLVVGTDSSGLNHPNWQQNLKVAVKIQEKAEEMYPGLLRPILVSSSRYNQNLRPGAFIVEVGATGNTLEQSLLSMKYFSKVLSETFK